MGKKTAEENLGPGVVLKITEILQNIHCIYFFDNFFSSPSCRAKLYERDLYGIDNSRKDRKEMLEIPVNRKMKRGDFEYLYFDKVACVSGWTGFR